MSNEERGAPEASPHEWSDDSRGESRCRYCGQLESIARGWMCAPREPAPEASPVVRCYMCRADRPESACTHAVGIGWRCTAPFLEACDDRRLAPRPASASPADEHRGLYQKYSITRTDGSSAPGGKHERCDYFVIDMTHDKYAFDALQAYAFACREEYPQLASDLLRRSVGERSDELSRTNRFSASASPEEFRVVLECIEATAEDRETRVLAGAALVARSHRTPEQRAALHALHAELAAPSPTRLVCACRHTLLEHTIAYDGSGDWCGKCGCKQYTQDPPDELRASNASAILCDLVNAGNAYGFTSDQFLARWKNARRFVQGVPCTSAAPTSTQAELIRRYEAEITTLREAIENERERCARHCEVLASMLEQGAGDPPPGARLRQAARNIRSGKPATLWTEDMTKAEATRMPEPEPSAASVDLLQRAAQFVEDSPWRRGGAALRNELLTAAGRCAGPSQLETMAADVDKAYAAAGEAMPGVLAVGASPKASPAPSLCTVCGCNAFRSNERSALKEGDVQVYWTCLRCDVDASPPSGDSSCKAHEDLDLLSRFIVDHAKDLVGRSDGACKQCYPDNTWPGSFVCAQHRAREIQAAQFTSTDQEKNR